MHKNNFTVLSQTRSVNETRLDGTESLTSFPLGDHIRVWSGGLYYHHMLVVEVTDAENLIVIHCTGYQNQDYFDSLAAESGVASASLSSFSVSHSNGIAAEIKEESILIRPKEQTVELLEYEGLNVVRCNGEEAIMRARTRVGDTSYSIFFKNCESFVNWAITGQEVTNQGELGLLAGGAAVGIGLMTLAAPLMVGAGLAFFAGYLNGKSSSKKD